MLVMAHTGSTKFGTYKVVTGRITEYRTRNITPNHYVVDAVITDADGVEYVTGQGRIIEEIAEPVEAAEPVEQPKTIVFKSNTCRRCDGERRDVAWGKVGGGWCFRCGGAGFLLTAAGKAASEAFDQAVAAKLDTVFGELEVGARFRFADSKKVWVKTVESVEFVASYRQVTRVDGKAKGRIMREIAERFPQGAELVF